MASLQGWSLGLTQPDSQPQPSVRLHEDLRAGAESAGAAGRGRCLQSWRCRLRHAATQECFEIARQQVINQQGCNSDMVNKDMISEQCAHLCSGTRCWKVQGCAADAAAEYTASPRATLRNPLPE